MQTMKRPAPLHNRLSQAGIFVMPLALLVLVVGGAFFAQKYTASRRAAGIILSKQLVELPPTTPTPDPPVVQPATPADVRIPPIVNGLAPVISHLDTKQPVVFLGIDDGVNKQSFELQIMKFHHIKATLFLSNTYIRDNPTFFTNFVTAGSVIEDHTVNHKELSKLSYAQQKQEICDEADLQTQQFGRRPILFRPPYGDYNQNTRRAAAACGMKAVVQWIAKANNGSMQYQIGNSLRPGDIVLMHFRPEFKADMQAFLNAQNAAGLHTELLENWLP
jgi:hypothetical protein